MASLVWVAVGGAVGSVARFAIAQGLHPRWYPWGTVLVNVAGSFALGYVIGKWGWDSDGPARLGLTVGLFGGFTTFSTFSLDALKLWEGGQPLVAAASVAVSVVAGVVAGVVGLALGRA